MATVARFAEVDWTNPPATEELPPELREVARKIRRKGLLAGEGGFFLSHVAMPPGHVADPHSHDHSELFVVLAGSMELRAAEDTSPLWPNDAAAIPANQTYGFTVGPEGVSFLLVRTGRARHTIARPSPSDS